MNRTTLKKVFDALKDLSMESGFCSYDVAEIADRCGLKPSTVERAGNVLRDRGIFVRLLEGSFAFDSSYAETGLIF